MDKIKSIDFAVVVPMANEEERFKEFIDSLAKSINRFKTGTVYLVVDEVSKDNTYTLCTEFSKNDNRFITIWAPENINVVDAYIRGYREAYSRGHDYIIEMDAGLSHDPALLSEFISRLIEGYECVLGSRFIEEGALLNTTWKRTFLSWGGTMLSNFLLGTKFVDFTSGYQGFNRSTVGKFIAYPFRSSGHFYQTEMRYLLRKKNYIEIPITYQFPSSNLPMKSIVSAILTLTYYFLNRLKGAPISI